MKIKHEYIKYYGEGSSNSYNLDKFKHYIDSIDLSKSPKGVNEIIELYNIQKITAAVIDAKTENDIIKRKKITDGFASIIAKFFKSINNDNILDIFQEVITSYQSDFWHLFSKYDLCSVIDNEHFEKLLEKANHHFQCVLYEKNIVSQYGAVIADFMRRSPVSFDVLIHRFLVSKSNNSKRINIPKEFTPKDIEKRLNEYVKYQKHNPNYLRLISIAQSSKECPISDELKISARHAYFDFWDKEIKSTGVPFGVEVSIDDIDEPVIITQKTETLSKWQYSRKLLLERLEYIYILKNFSDLFPLVDFCYRSNQVSIESKSHNNTDQIAVKGSREFYENFCFIFNNKLASSRIEAYYLFLNENNINIENVFKWFFEQYLIDTFGVEGFSFSPSSFSSDIVEKCKSLSSEMERVLKQFKLYLKYGKIDSELFEESSEHLIYSSIGSFAAKKYAYIKSSAEKPSKLFLEQHLLFSESSLLAKYDLTNNTSKSFFDLLWKNRQSNFQMKDFKEKQLDVMKPLFDTGSLYCNDSGMIIPNWNRILILVDLNENDVIYPLCFDKAITIIDQMVENGELYYGSTLLSLPEQNYFNYLLNKSQYSNGYDIRNKYAHGTYSLDKNVQFNDYITLIKLMITIIFKLIQEFQIMKSLEDNRDK